MFSIYYDPAKKHYRIKPSSELAVEEILNTKITVKTITLAKRIRNELNEKARKNDVCSLHSQTPIHRFKA